MSGPLLPGQLRRATPEIRALNKAQLNFVIDALMFLSLAAIAGLGFLMKYILLPGREIAAKFGRRVELSWQIR